MTAPVLAVAHRLAGRRAGAVRTFTEVPAARGVADIVIVQFDPRMLAVERPAVGDYSDVLVLLALTDRAVGGVDAASTRDLACHVGFSSGHLTTTCLPRLRDKGLVKTVGRGSWTATSSYQSPVRTLATVELKRRDWLSGLRQASLHGVGADFAWTVLDSTALRTDRDRFQVASQAHRERGIGFATATPSGRLIMHVPARGGGPVADRSLLARANRALLAERVFDFATQGVSSGPTWPVFGRELVAVGE